MKTTNNNQPKHTQGEWLIRTKEENFSRKVTDFKGSLLANVFADTDEEAEGNAKIIALAPEMLNELIRIQKSIQKILQSPSGISPTEIWKLLYDKNQTNNIISKATE